MNCLLLIDGTRVVEYYASRVDCIEWAWLWRWAGYAVWMEAFK